MADVFEPRTDLDPWREKLWDLIEKTPHLDWLLLTKRPRHIKNVYPWAHALRDNVWLGTTAENQRWTNRRIERLLTVDAHVRFLPCEPLLSAIDLIPWLKNKQINWIIAGGESGREARPTHPNWIRSLRGQCHPVAPEEKVVVVRCILLGCRGAGRLLPCRAFRLGGQKAPWLVSAVDWADLIDRHRQRPWQEVRTLRPRQQHWRRRVPRVRQDLDPEA
jgi:hypothetical protein